jgi:hypothetical protein
MAQSGERDRKSARGLNAAAGRSIGPVLRLFGVGAIACLAAGTAVLMYPRADGVTAPAPVRSEPVRTAATSVKSADPAPVAEARTKPTTLPAQTTGTIPRPLPAPAVPKAPMAAAPAQRAIPAPTPLPVPPSPPPPAAAYAPLPASAPARSPEIPAPAKSSEQAAPARFVGASVDCLSADLVTVLREVQNRFGQVTVVSGKEVHTRNHSSGSARHKLHADCKAVDFTVSGDVDQVLAFVKARPEVNGVNSYRPNGLIHIDVNERRRLATR